VPLEECVVRLGQVFGSAGAAESLARRLDGNNTPWKERIEAMQEVDLQSIST
jgi:hypothetical protein